MVKYSRLAALIAATALSAGLMAVDATAELQAQTAMPANPCAPKAANPCAPKAANPCAPRAGGDAATKPEVDAKLVVRPKGTNLTSGDTTQLVKQGKALFSDTRLSTNGMSCQACHASNENFAPSFAKAYPHEVAMAKAKGGIDKVRLDEMVQLCMVVPMAAKPLPWDSRELAALTAYTGELQKSFRKQPRKGEAKAANPCAPRAANPCAPKK